MHFLIIWFRSIGVHVNKQVLFIRTRTVQWIWPMPLSAFKTGRWFPTILFRESIYLHRFYPPKNPNLNIPLFNFHSFLLLGPRICPGESLAKTEMFLVFSNLVQKFRFCKVSETDEFDLEGLTGITTFACPYRLKVEIR